MPRQKDYIPCAELWMSMTAFESDMFTPKRKLPIEQIQFDVRVLAYPNNVNFDHVENIVANFDALGWTPIFINPDNYLIDGQHRLEVAKRFGLKFIDVVVVSEDYDDKTL